MDLTLVKTKISNVKGPCGCTNMAQGFMTSDGVLSQGGWESVQSTALIISDGRCLIKYRTAEKVLPP